MTMVVGVSPDRRGRSALHLAGLLARSAKDDLVLCTVIPAPWPPSPAKVDAEYRTELERVAAEALAQARAEIPADISAATLVRPARSVPADLLEAAEEHDARLLVVGPSPAGALGRVALGSVSGRLLHSSPILVALPPRGYRCALDARVTRVTAAYGGSPGSDDLVVAAADVTARVGASLRLASFAVRPRPPYTSGVGTVAEHAMVEQWVQEIESAGRAVLDRVRERAAVPRGLETVVGYGETWEEALEDVEWQDGDVLVVGSSAVGPIARVFLGSRASKIVRSSPVPVVAVPRGTAEERAGRAARADQAASTGRS
jgi:nucleotide-binding universal stress UspA family protein